VGTSSQHSRENAACEANSLSAWGPGLTLANEVHAGRETSVRQYEGFLPNRILDRGTDRVMCPELKCCEEGRKVTGENLESL
jgi:hypothetical protein